MRSVLYVIAGGALGDAVGRGVNVLSGDVTLFRRPVTMAFVLSPTSGFTGGRVTVALSRLPQHRDASGVAILRLVCRS